MVNMSFEKLDNIQINISMKKHIQMIYITKQQVLDL